MPPPAGDDVAFGSALAFANTAWLVGSPKFTGVGSVWIVDPASAGGGTPYCSGLPNSTGLAGELIYRGSPSVAGQQLSVRARNLVPGESALLFYGPGQQRVPLGDGLLCVTGPWYRLGLLTIGPAGRAGQACRGPESRSGAARARSRRGRRGTSSCGTATRAGRRGRT